MLVWDLRRLQTPSTDTISVCLLLIPPTRDLTMNVDKKCPFTGDVSIRGRILTGRVISTKMTRTIIIRRDYLHFIPKYRARSFYYEADCLLMMDILSGRFEKRHKNLAAHVSPAFRVDLGDVVTVGTHLVPGYVCHVSSGD